MRKIKNTRLLKKLLKTMADGAALGVVICGIFIAGSFLEQTHEANYAAKVARDNSLNCAYGPVSSSCVLRLAKR